MGHPGATNEPSSLRATSRLRQYNAAMSDVAGLLSAIEDGDATAADQLLTLAIRNREQRLDMLSTDRPETNEAAKGQQMRVSNKVLSFVIGLTGVVLCVGSSSGESKNAGLTSTGANIALGKKYTFNKTTQTTTMKQTTNGSHEF